MANDHTVVVIGSGFGGSLAALSIAHDIQKRRKAGDGSAATQTVHMLERGTWWTTPVGTVQDPEVKTPEFLAGRDQPVQYWPSVDHFKGLIDILLRCFRRKGNEDGLYDVTSFGRFGLFGDRVKHSDGVTVLRASGVGGGSLVYSNILMRPPSFVTRDPRWVTTWSPDEEDHYFELARAALGLGVLHARDHGEPTAKPVYTGLSNVATRSARLDPQWRTIPVAGNPRGLKQLDTNAAAKNALWIDRARVFQTNLQTLTADYGLVDLAINDLPAGAVPYDPQDEPANYCERSARCSVGCLAGARHTLNKQLMLAIFGSPAGDPPQLDGILSLDALVEVDVIEALPTGGYRVRYQCRDKTNPSETTPGSVTADRVVLAAGCVGTIEILLRSKDQAVLPGLSDKLGCGFSTNGDYMGFIDTDQHVRLTRGPVTTSFARFHTPAANPDESPDPAKFHTLEDNGIPPAFASTIGFGIPLVRQLANDNKSRLLVLWTIVRWLFHRGLSYLKAFFTNARERADEFKSEEEFTDRMMCITAFGREASVGQFRLGTGGRETTLRVSRSDGLAFHEDPVYATIEQTLAKVAPTMSSDPNAKFTNAFVNSATGALEADAVMVTHPLGGCRMATSPANGAVDEYGRVFDASRAGPRPFYEGLYVADASVIPTALGVNPALTISALSLRIADKVCEELRAR